MTAEAPPVLHAPARLTAFALAGIGEVHPGMDLAGEIAAALQRSGERLQDGDIVVIASKIVAKAQGRTVPEQDRDGAITAESTHLVAARALPDGRLTRVVHTVVGPVLAAAGVDASDVAAGTVLLLPEDPDAAARAIRAGLAERTGVAAGVLITDTSGRPWRAGVSDYCLGAAGVDVLDDRRGTIDAAGRPLSVTVRNLADELACLADLVKAKSAGTPVALVRGLAAVVHDENGSGAAPLVRTGPSDWFRHGHVEAVWSALGRPGTIAQVSAPAIDPDAEPTDARVNRAIGIALACPGVEDVAVDHGGVDDGDVDAGGVDHGGAAQLRQVRIHGPSLAVGRVLERLLTAAWAEDLQAHVTETIETAGGCEVHLGLVRA